MACCILLFAIFTSQKGHSANIAAVLFKFAFNFFTPIGSLGLNRLYVTEISPAELRNYIIAILSGNNWIWNFFVTMITPVAITLIRWRYYIVYAVIGFAIPILLLIFFLETLGLELEAIDLILRRASSAWNVVKTGKEIRKSLLSEGEQSNILEEFSSKAEVEHFHEGKYLNIAKKRSINGFQNVNSCK
ncbi:uncharacterized protein PRCAT00005778001 [Priceomyces carsonii]|uniref:uncharacterized protein n=1 Tax=Priceomyces carsonii TaxID=28549 RepID=UPI002ED96747|nr:unnamed protein product [Priceomyces carsonii]